MRIQAATFLPQHVIQAVNQHRIRAKRDIKIKGQIYKPR